MNQELKEELILEVSQVVVELEKFHYEKMTTIGSVYKDSEGILK